MQNNALVIAQGLELSSELLRAVAAFNEALIYDQPSNMMGALAKIRSRADDIDEFVQTTDF
jgi:hypothetical protein